MRIALKLTVGAVAVVVAMTMSARVSAWGSYGTWTATPVNFVMNPQNLDVAPDAAEAAVRSAMDTWNAVPNSKFRFYYAGRTGATTSAYDNQNVIVFRPDGDGSEIARTYSWQYGSTIVDTDIVFWDGPYTFYTGNSGCGTSGYGVYVEDVATHELGHALGLQHSAVPTATMVSGYPACSVEKRSLDPDDIAAVQSLYPGTVTGSDTGGGGSTQPVNTAPTMKILSPANGASYGNGVNVSFSGSSSDTQDGNIASWVVWTSDRDGQIGTGGSFSKALTSGTHVITAQVTDRGGLTATAQLTMSVAAPTPSTPVSSPVVKTLSLAVKAYKNKGLQAADLSWSGTAAASLDVYRNNLKVAKVANSGTYSDAINKKGAGTYSYYVCESGTTTCSNTATATF
jgi:hypothetical protein